MKGFNIVFTTVIVIIAVVFAVSNIIFLSSDNSDDSRPYRVEAYRIKQEIEDIGYENISLSGYSYITNVEKLSADNMDTFYDGDSSDYLIIQMDNELYRFDYSYESNNNKTIVILNILLGIMALVIIVTMIYLKMKIIRPFNILKNVPYELSKGNLTIPLKENKNRYFGNFIWGMDLLREHLEQQKINELRLQKEKKTLVLSISHDIKTPLGIIELYAKALEKNLYKDKQKQKQIAVSITEKCSEIKEYVSEIIKASNEDFLNLDVDIGEFYLSEIVKTISSFYTEKLNLLKIDFTIGKFSDCILKGDINRSVEVIQNIMENAIKYGDGKSIEVTFAQEEDCIIISVTNSGCSLSENELPHIFDSFWRGSNVGSNRGSGLGLYICRQIMKKMDGDIFAECHSSIIKVSAVFRMV